MVAATMRQTVESSVRCPASRANAADTLTHTDARLPAEDRRSAIALVVQSRERRLQAIHRDRRLATERTERVFAELAEGEHDETRHAHDRLRAACETEHVFLREVIGVDDLNDLATDEDAI